MFKNNADIAVFVTINVGANGVHPLVLTYRGHFILRILVTLKETLKTSKVSIKNIVFNITLC
jgi:hypothetical protein